MEMAHTHSPIYRTHTVIQSDSKKNKIKYQVKKTRSQTCHSNAHNPSKSRANSSNTLYTQSHIQPQSDTRTSKHPVTTAPSHASQTQAPPVIHAVHTITKAHSQSRKHATQTHCHSSFINTSESQTTHTHTHA